VIIHAKDALREIAEQESSLRGYLLAKDRSLLRRFEEARPSDTLRTLKSLVRDLHPLAEK
jgi:CHASE3 domain sensor protein